MISKVWSVGVLLVGCGGGLQPVPTEPPPPPAPEQTDPPLTVAETPLEPDPDAGTEPVQTAVSVEVGSATGWTQFHGGPARTGASAAPAIARPKILWSHQVGIQGWLNGPLALGGDLVIVSSSGKLHNKPDAEDGVVALELRTGKRAWHARFPQDANGVAANQTHVFATCDDGHLYALDIRKGGVAWKHAGEGKMYSHPLLVADKVIVGDAAGNVYALAQSDGKLAWKLTLSGAIRGGASADGSHVYVASQGGEVAKLGFDGKTAWKHAVKRPPWDGRGQPEAIEVYSPPIVDQDVIIVPFARDTYYEDVPGFLALDKKTGRDRWRAKGPGQWGNVRSTAALVAGTLVYAEPYSGDIVGLASSTGRMLYRHTVGPCLFPSWASPAAAGDVVYVPRFDGTVHAVRASSGKELWKIYLGDKRHAGSTPPAAPASRHGCDWEVGVGSSIYSPAAVSETGTLLVGTAEGWLYAIGG